MWLISTGLVGGNLPFKLRPGEFSAGRSRNCHIIIQDSSVSRVHARLTVNPSGDVHLLDLGSRNGTYVNCIRVVEIRPNLMDHISLGAVQLHFTLDPAIHGTLDGSTIPALPALARTHARIDPPLSHTQKAVLQLVAKGLSDETVADLLGRSYHTIRQHLKVIFKAYDVHSKHELLGKLNGNS